MENKNAYTAEMEYWMKEGPRTGAFLLVIPGATCMGIGAGLLNGNVPSYGLIGFGAGLVIWGLAVVFRPFTPGSPYEAKT
ncbi:MAG: hypothetical protein ACJ763_10490 [Bdellovibrionia bacterium]